MVTSDRYKTERKIDVKKIICIMIFCGLLLTACNGVTGRYDTNTLIITKDGIQEISIEDYSSLDVTKEQLQAYIEEEISPYQSSGAVVMDEFTYKDNIAALAISYDSMETYNAFNATDYELISAGDWKYKASQIKNMVSAEGESLTEEDVNLILEDADASVLLLDAQTDVVIKGELLAFSGAEYEDGDTLHANEDTIIIFK